MAFDKTKDDRVRQKTVDSQTIVTAAMLLHAQDKCNRPSYDTHENWDHGAYMMQVSGIFCFEICRRSLPRDLRLCT